MRFIRIYTVWLSILSLPYFWADKYRDIYIFWFSIKMYVVGTHEMRMADVLLMRTHNIYLVKIKIRAQLFKANDIVSLWFVKIYIKWYANKLKFFAKKNVSSFCSAKATHIFLAKKNIRRLCIETAKTVNEMTLNKLVKLMTLWTTGSRKISNFWLKMAYLEHLLLCTVYIAELT